MNDNNSSTTNVDKEILNAEIIFKKSIKELGYEKAKKLFAEVFPKKPAPIAANISYLKDIKPISGFNYCRLVDSNGDLHGERFQLLDTGDGTCHDKSTDSIRALSTDTFESIFDNRENPDYDKGNDYGIRKFEGSYLQTVSLPKWLQEQHLFFQNALTQSPNILKFISEEQGEAVLNFGQNLVYTLIGDWLWLDSENPPNSSNTYFTWIVNTGGSFNYDFMNITSGVRPALNLKSGIFIISGTGTIDDPYLVTI